MSVPEVETSEAPEGHSSRSAEDVGEGNGSGGEVVDYRTLIEQIPAITYTEIHGGAGQRTAYVSPQATDILGYTPQQFIQDHRHWRTLRHPADRATVGLSSAPPRSPGSRSTPHGTRIWVRVLPQDGGVLVCVEDEGPGVPDELKDSIFEPFRKGEAGTRGSGIGLSLVSRFAEFHGGRAWVQDRPGGGAAFFVFLPGTGRRPPRGGRRPAAKRRPRSGFTGSPRLEELDGDRRRPVTPAGWRAFDLMCL